MRRSMSASEGDKGNKGDEGAKGDNADKGDKGVQGDKGISVRSEPLVEYNTWTRHSGSFPLDRCVVIVRGRYYVSVSRVAIWGGLPI